MSKKILSLFLAVVMLALAIPAAVLPAFAAEERSSGAITETWTGSEEDATLNLVPAGYEYFLSWFEGGAQLPVGGGVANATAKINPQLIEAGIVSAEDNVATAFNKWAAYMKENAKITYNGNWSLSGINGDSIETIAHYHYYNNRSIGGLYPGYNEIVPLNDAAWIVKSEIDRVYDALWSQLVNAGAIWDNNIMDLGLATSDVLRTSVRPQTWETSSSITALDSGIVCRKTGAAYTYTVPADGTLKLSVGSITGAATAECAVLVNGTAVLPYTAIDLSFGDAAATINAALGALNIPVQQGDQVSLAVKNGGTVKATVTAELPQELEPSETITESWSGSNTDFTVKTIETDHKYFLSWFVGDTKLNIGQGGAHNGVAKINPLLIQDGIVSASDTVKQAYDKWVAYMKENAKITYNGNWSLSNVSGSSVEAIAYCYYYNNRSIGYLWISATNSASNELIPVNDSYWVTESGINRAYDALYSQLLNAGAEADGTVSEMSLAYGSIMGTSVRPQAWELGSRIQNVADGIIVGGDGAAYTYTVPTDGNLKLSVGSITGAATAECAVLVNGTEVLPYTAIDLSSGDAAATINAALAALDIPVQAGDQVSLAVKNGGTVVAAVKAELSLAALPTAASITITSKYVINIFVEGGEGVTGAGIIIDSKMISGVQQEDGSYKVAAMSVDAGKLRTASVTYIPYQVYGDEYSIGLSSKTVSAMSLLNAYVKGDYDETTKALAQGVLDFTAALNAFETGAALSSDVKLRLRGEPTIAGVPLSGKNDIYLGTLKYISTGEVPKYTSANQNQEFVADPTLTEADKVKIGYEEGVDPTSAEYKFAIKAATLNLEERIGFAFRVVANSGSSVSDLREGGVYKLQAFDGVSYAYYDAFLYEGADKTSKAIVVDGVPASRYDRDFEFTIVEEQADGSYKAVGATMTYSVKAYAVQTFTFGSDDFASYLAQALFRLGVVADEYVAAHPVA